MLCRNFELIPIFKNKKVAHKAVYYYKACQTHEACFFQLT